MTLFKRKCNFHSYVSYCVLPARKNWAELPSKVFELLKGSHFTGEIIIDFRFLANSYSYMYLLCIHFCWWTFFFACNNSSRICLMIKFLKTIFSPPITKTQIDFWISLLDATFAQSDKMVNLLMENMWSKEVCHRRAATTCSKYIWYKIVPSYFSFAEIDQESCVGSAGTVLYRSDMWCLAWWIQ